MPQGSGGELSGGQTKEHAQLARSLGVEQLAVVISKLDVAGFDQVWIIEQFSWDLMCGGAWRLIIFTFYYIINM
jgi:hypothetical protein